VKLEANQIATEAKLNEVKSTGDAKLDAVKASVEAIRLGAAKDSLEYLVKYGRLKSTTEDKSTEKVGDALKTI